MHAQFNFNTKVLWGYYHGLISEEYVWSLMSLKLFSEWKVLKTNECCQKATDVDTDDCDWFHLVLPGNNFLKMDLDTNSKCGKIVNLDIYCILFDRRSTCVLLSISSSSFFY